MDIINIDMDIINVDALIWYAENQWDPFLCQHKEGW